MTSSPERRLREVAALRMGETIIAEDCTGDGIPIYSADTSVSAWRYSRHPRLLIKRGAIVVGARGSIGFPRMPEDAEFAATQTTIVIEPSRIAVVPRFLLHALRGVDFARVTAQQAVPMLTVKELGALALHIPSLAQQHRIAEVLDTLDETIWRTEQLIAKLKQVKQGLLHDLLTRGIDDNGELRDPERHPEQFKPSALGLIPTAWTVEHTAAVCSLITKGSTPGSKDMWQGGGGVPFLRVDNLSFDGSLDLQASQFRVSEQTHEGPLSRSKVFPGDVLTNIVGPPLGKIGLVPPELRQANINQAIAVLRPAERILPNFLLLWLAGDWSRRWLRRNAKQTSGQLNLTLGMCRELPLPSIEIAEQTRIVSRMDALQDRLRADVALRAKLVLLKQGLMEDLLTGRVRVSDVSDEAAA